MRLQIYTFFLNGKFKHPSAPHLSTKKERKMIFFLKKMKQNAVFKRI